MPAPLLIPAVLGAAQAGVALLKGGKAKREAKQLAASRPKLEASPFIDEQLSLAQSELSSGMSGATETAYEEGLSRDLSSSLNTILQGGGDVNNVAQIFDRSAVGRQRLSMMKENLRLNQINNLSTAQAAAENERQQRFQFNEFAPWADAAKANAGARQGAENMLWSGIQTAAGAATGMLQGAQARNDFNNYSALEKAGASNSNLRSSTPQTASVNYGRVNSPASRYSTITPNDMFGNSGINEQYFQYPGEYE